MTQILHSEILQCLANGDMPTARVHGRGAGFNRCAQDFVYDMGYGLLLRRLLGF